MRRLFFIIFLMSTIHPSDNVFQRVIKAEGDLVQVVDQVNPFSKIFASVGTIYLDPLMQAHKVIAQGEESILAALSISTFNDVLYITSSDPLEALESEKLKIFVGIADCSKLALAGNGYYIFKNKLCSSTLDLEILQKANCILQCSVNNLYLKISGNANVACSGQADHYEVFVLDNAFADISQLEGRCLYNRATKNALIKMRR